MEITVVYPAYNESENVRATLTKSVETLREITASFEVLVIDDGSRDGTAEIVEEMARVHPEIRFLRNEQNIGQGSTLKKGFAEAKLEWVMHNAMDYPFDLQDLRKLDPLLGSADVIVVSRKTRSGYSLYRVVLSAGNRLLLRALFGLPVRDLNFVQLYRRCVFDSVQAETNSTAFLTPELVIRANDQGFRVREIEIEYHPRLHGVATAGKLSVVCSSLRDMLRFWIVRRTGRKHWDRTIEGC